MRIYDNVITAKKIDAEYEDWFRKTLDEAYRRSDVQGFSSSEAWLSACGYVQTITFDQKVARLRRDNREVGQSDTTLEFDAFHGGYIEITKQLVGDKRYHKPKFAHLWPFAFVGLDVEGSRYGDVNEFRQHNLHIHAIWCLHPSLTARFEKLVSHDDLVPRFQSYGPCDAVEFKRYAKPNSGSRTYGIKAHTKLFWNPSSAEDLRIYPNPDPNVRRISYRMGKRVGDQLGPIRPMQIAMRTQALQDSE